jgi:hypothetical protein
VQVSVLERLVDAEVGEDHFADLAGTDERCWEMPLQKVR